MKKEYFQKEVKKGGHSKRMKNIAAMQSATRDEDRIVYDSKKPLIINDEDKISEIVIVDNEELEDEVISELDTEKTIRIIFQDKDNVVKKEFSMQEKVPYTMDIHTYISLDEFEALLAKCKTIEAIEELQDL